MTNYASQYDYGYCYGKGYGGAVDHDEVVKVTPKYYVSGMPTTRYLDSYYKKLKAERIENIVPLLTEWEGEMYYFEDLYEEYSRAGLKVYPFPIEDGSVPKGMGNFYRLVKGLAENPGKTIVHCMGGNGRSGLLLACLLVYGGIDPKEAILLVRDSRPRAVESMTQVKYISKFERYMEYLSGRNMR